MVQLVKFLRPILVGLGVAIVLFGMLAAAAFSPDVQTWFAQRELDQQPGLRGTVGAVSAGLHAVELTKLHLETDSAVIDVPALQVTLPVTTAVWNKKVQVRSLVAYGWTIDLSRPLETEPAPAPAGPVPGGGTAAETAVRPEAPAIQATLKLLRGILGGQALPWDLSLDGVDLEGDVVFAPPGREPIRVHLVIRGGGVAAGREGVFAIEAAAPSPWTGISAVSAKGQVAVAAGSSRKLERIEIKADCSIQGEAPADNSSLTVELGALGEAAETIFSLDLSRGARHLATIRAHYPDATRRLGGDWNVDWRGSDLGQFAMDRGWPSFSATGEGHFDADSTFTQLQVLGRMDFKSDPSGRVAPLLDRLGAATLSTHFNLERDEHVIRFDELDATLSANGPSVSVKSLQPFEIDGKTGGVSVKNMRDDWMEGSVRAFPLARIAGPAGTFALAGGDVTGDFAVRAANGGLTLRPKQAWTVADVSLQRAGRTLVRNLDLSLAWQVDHDAAGWRVQLPLMVSHAGRRVASVEAKASRPAGADPTILVDGTWQADLEALAALPGIPRGTGLTGRSASGEFTANVGSLSQVEGKMTVVGHDPSHVLTASVSADENTAGKWTFQIPLNMALGTQVSDLSAEGSWSDAANGGRSYVRLTGGTVVAGQLRRLAAVVGLPWPSGIAMGSGGSTPPPGEADRTPFWGSGTATVVFDFDQLKAGEKIYQDVGGDLEISPGSLKLDHARAGLAHGPPVQLEGRISFEAAAKFPYDLKASGIFGDVDATALLPPAPPDEDALVEGHFSVADTLTGSGRTLDDLAGRTQQEIRLQGKAGIIRLLKVSIGDAFQEGDSSEVSDTVGEVGSLVGKLFAVPKGSGEKKVSKTVENVIDLTSAVAEIEYDSLNLTAVRSTDGTIRITEFAMTSPEVRLTGTGRIAGGSGRPYTARPLTLDLMLGARGRTAGLLGKAGLLSSRKDSLGYTDLGQSLRFSGSLEHPDPGAWHDLLVKAAKKKPGGG